MRNFQDCRKLKELPAVFFRLVLFFVTLVNFLGPSPVSASNVDYVDELVSRAREEKLWERKEWLNLGHYRKRLWRGYESQADGLTFFLAGERGKFDPEAELEATLRGFFLPPALGKKQHPQCLFPARFLWLESSLRWDISKFPKISCEKYVAYRKQVDAHSVSLVFSSYYLNNPSSAFGHTFLKLNKSLGQSSDLLDQGVNYAAIVDTNNPIFYAFKGLSGLFHGTFTSMPYYYKVREYNDYEARDLWEYELNLTDREMQMLVAHLWELGSTYFDYYYLTENCSYHVLTALEAAAPRYTLTDHLPYYVIPADSIKVAFDAPGLFGPFHYRPSNRTQFNDRLKSLTGGQRSLLKRVISSRDVSSIEKLSDSGEKAQILDAAADYFDFRYSKEILKQEKGILAFKQKLLVARSQLGIMSPKMEIKPPVQEAAHVGHGSARADLGGGYSNQLGSYVKFSYRFALHDLLDPSVGYPDYIELEFLDMGLLYQTRSHSVWLEHLNLFNVFSLSDFNPFYRQFSWKFLIGAKTFRDPGCENCLGGTMEGGVGLSKKLGEAVPLWMTLTLDGELSGSPDFNGSDVRFRYGPMAQVRASFLPNLQLLLKSQYRRALLSFDSSDLASTAGFRWGVTKNLALDFQGDQFWLSGIWEGGAKIIFYY